MPVDRRMPIFRGARQFTAQFARDLGLTVFGVYKCHHPMGNLQIHTPVLFSGVRDPPYFTRPHDNTR
jgi:hypothetical protein